MKKIAYHYANEETFLAILKSKTIRLSDITMMNDWDEYSCGFRIIENIVQRDFPDKLTLLEGVNPSNLNAAFGIIIGSFSTNGDCLSLWRGYGDDGRGMSIGFNIDEVKNHSLFSRYMSTGQPVTGNVNFFPVVYNDGSFEAKAVSYLSKFSVANPINDGALRLALMRLCSTYKNDFFIDEREVRAVIELSDSCDPYELKSAESAYGEKKFHELNTSYGSENAIKHIFLGPKSKIQTQEILKRLVAVGLTDVQVTKSRGSYR